MNAKTAIQELDSMASQFIGHEKTNIFAEIAGVMRKQEEVRLAALKAVGSAIDRMALMLPPDDDTFLAHRILSTSEPDGIPKGEVINSSNTEVAGGSPAQ